jgi:alkanesulfonate monooxygenase SsuD/methylene tetrahydromethanopterin reductase-like flavin-dependent oxidoreductase (luciferase family)
MPSPDNHTGLRVGYFLSSEEYTPAQLVEQAVAAEAAGFDALWISDHFHPWNDEQGQSPFMWTVLGALGQVTSLPVTTAVTCPTVRQHPAIVAQAAATSAAMLPGGLTLGVGTGEALNEHILGSPWPTFEVRMEMLEEAIEVIRELWRATSSPIVAGTTRSTRPGSARCPRRRRASSCPGSARVRSTPQPGWPTGSSRPSRRPTTLPVSRRSPKACRRKGE